MRKYILTAALVVAGLPLTPAMARQMDGYVVRSTLMRAGPDYDYPAERRSLCHCPDEGGRTRPAKTDLDQLRRPAVPAQSRVRATW